MTGNDIRAAYLKFFTAAPRNHLEIPAARIVPENDPTTLFTSSGMQPLVPYLKGQPHSMGTRLVDSQPSFRAEDIDEVGDNRHTTFFEMLGNWSLGDYFKEDQLKWFFNFLINVVKLESTRLFVTVFKGDEYAPKDTESVMIWQNLFMQVAADFAQRGINEVTVNEAPENGLKPSDRIFYYGAKKNWWSRSGIPANMPIGEIGGPDSEVFFDFDPDNKLQIHENSIYKANPCHPNCDCGRFLEIGNSVFMQYIKAEDGFFKPLPKQNVDFGGGLERIAAAANENLDVFKTDLFWPIIEEIENYTSQKYEGENKPKMRIIADHIKAATFMIAEGLEPSNKLQGYVLRRLIRRASTKLHQLGGGLTSSPSIGAIAEEVLRIYDGKYFDRSQIRDRVEQVIDTEMMRFAKTLDKGLRQIEKADQSQINGKFAFDLYQTYGFPLELTEELVKEKGITIDRQLFRDEFKKHQDLSRSASQGLFKGGLADHSDTIVKYHTTTHLLHAALRQVLGHHVQQMGSNITAERLRFDFKHNEKMTPEQLQQVESLVNAKIREDLPVHKTIEDKDTALQSGAMAFFRDKYPDKVSVYTIGRDPDKDWFSKELCGGPHVTSTGLIGPVTIKKEEAVGAGVRRIYMTLQ